jgi:hypothetical protein
MLGGSSVHLDSKTGGLLIELPSDASFAKQNLERPENADQLKTFVTQVFEADLSLSFVLGAPSTTTASGVRETDAEEAEPRETVPLTTEAEAPSLWVQEADTMDADEVNDDSRGASVPQASIEDILLASFGASVPVNEVPPRL